MVVKYAYLLLTSHGHMLSAATEYCLWHKCFTQTKNRTLRLSVIKFSTVVLIVK